MKNYLFIDGKKIPLSDETAENIKIAFSKEDDLLQIANNCDATSLSEVTVEFDSLIHIGNNACERKYKGKCLLVKSNLIPEVLLNNEEFDDSFKYIIIFHKKE